MAEAIHAVRCLVLHDVNPGASRVENRFASFPPYELAGATMRAYCSAMAVGWMAEAIHAVRCLVLHDANPGAFHVENRFASFPPYELAGATMRAYCSAMAVGWMAEAIHAVRCLVPHDVSPGASRVENRFASFPPYETASA